MPEETIDTVTCPSCDAQLVAGLRFCRMCGYRLGEGVEEYVPTQLLDPAAAPAQTTDPFVARQTWGGMQSAQPIRPLGTTSLKQSANSSMSGWAAACSPKRAGWWTWIVLVMLIFLIGGGVLSSVIKNRGMGGGGGGQGKRLPETSLMKEADGYDTVDGGGAMIRGLAGPGTSLEAAGLVGGDVITSFDGKPVRDGDALEKLIASTRIGQAVEVIYIHDGETKKTMLTTTGREGFRGMDSIGQRPGGRGILDVDFDDGDRVRVPNTNIYGVELDSVERNGPADLAGLKEGDIITEFDGKPIRTAGDLRYRAGIAMPGVVVNIIVIRDGQQITIPVKMGRQR